MMPGKYSVIYRLICVDSNIQVICFCSTNSAKEVFLESENYKKGIEILNIIDPGAADRAKKGLGEISPDMVRYLMEFVFGEISARPGLDMKLREITAVAALTAIGTAPNQLKVHIKGALNCGCSRDEIVEVIMQVLVYAGFPAALNGLRTAKDVFSELDKNEN